MEFMETIGTYIKFGAISIVPIVCWLFFFQKQNRERNKYVALTFIAGMLSVLPIKMYEKFWNTSVWIIEHFNLFEYLADVVHLPTLPRVMAFVVVGALVAGMLYLAAALLMFVIEVITTRDNTLKVFQKKFVKISESPLLFISIGALMGVSAYFLSETFATKVWFFVVVGMLEEFIKYLMLRFSDEEKIRSVSDSISFAIIIALGFAFVENGIYLWRFWENSANAGVLNFTMFFLLRSTVSVIAHVCFSAIIGYFYGKAHFSTEIYREETKDRQHQILEWFHKVFHLKGTVLFHEEQLLEGMLVAVVLHAIFNSLLELGQIVYVFPMLFVMFGVVLKLLHKKSSHIKRGLWLQRIEVDEES